jgi:hypothetical protein
VSLAGEPSVETLRMEYGVLSQARIDYNVRKWDVVRVASVFALGVFAASGGLLARDDAPRIGYLIAGPVLVISAAILWWWARDGIRRESRLQYATEFSMYQIERQLGLHDSIPADDRWLPGQARLFGEKHTDWTFRTGARPDDASGRHDLDWWLDEKVGAHVFVGAVDLLFLSFFLATVGFGVALVSLGV